MEDLVEKGSLTVTFVFPYDPREQSLEEAELLMWDSICDCYKDQLDHEGLQIGRSVALGVEPDSIEGGVDYILKSQSCWITVKNLSIYVAQHDEGVAVDITPRGHETDSPVAGTWVLYSEGEVDERR